MRMVKDKVISSIVPALIPYIILYSLYIHLNGEVSPGGGFQAGVIFATCIIIYDLLFGINYAREEGVHDLLVKLGAFGVFLYALTGVLSFMMGDNYLNYNNFTSNKLLAQHIGIVVIEIGILITVSSIMTLIYLLIRPKNVFANIKNS